MPDGLTTLLEAQPGMVVGVGLGAVAVLWAWLRRRRGGQNPHPGEMWFAEVPFEDRRGSKDRPVLVLAVRGRRCTVAATTSQDRSARRDHARVPDGMTGLTKSSWIRLRPITVRRSALRRRVSNPGPALVRWYEEAAARQGR